VGKIWPDSDIRLEFSPEEFTDTDLDFSWKSVKSLYSTWGRATQEKAAHSKSACHGGNVAPNQYATWLSCSASGSLTWKTHYFPTCPQRPRHGSSPTELALIAGGQRVEGTLFGLVNELVCRLVVLANNFYARRHPDRFGFFDLPKIAGTVERHDKHAVPSGAVCDEYRFHAFLVLIQDAHPQKV